MEITIHNPKEGNDILGQHLYNRAVSKITVIREWSDGTLKCVYTRMDVPYQHQDTISPYASRRGTIPCMAWGLYIVGTGIYTPSSDKLTVWFPVNKNWATKLSNK